MSDKKEVIAKIFKDVKKRCRDFMQNPGEAIPFMVWTIEQLQAMGKTNICFMEIGVAFAGNFTFMSDSLMYYFNNVHGIAMDKAKSLGHIQHMRPKCQWDFIYGNSQHASAIKTAKELGACNLDLLYIDGGHRDTECANDLNNYSAGVTSGIIAIHDYQVLRHKRKYPSILTAEKKHEHQEWIAPKSQMGIGAFLING